MRNSWGLSLFNEKLGDVLHLSFLGELYDIYWQSFCVPTSSDNVTFGLLHPVALLLQMNYQLSHFRGEGVQRLGQNNEHCTTDQL